MTLFTVPWPVMMVAQFIKWIIVAFPLGYACKKLIRFWTETPNNERAGWEEGLEKLYQDSEPEEVSE